MLEKDIFDPRLKTHKLHGKMMKHIDQYACTLDYDIRILFTFDSKKVYLREIGTHNELYY